MLNFWKTVIYRIRRIVWLPLYLWPKNLLFRNHNHWNSKRKLLWALFKMMFFRWTPYIKALAQKCYLDKWTGKSWFKSWTKFPHSRYEKTFNYPHLAWADFKIKAKQIAHSTVHFNQWNPLISKMLSLKIFTGLFVRTPRSPRSNDLETQNNENSIMKSDKN